MKILGKRKFNNDLISGWKMKIKQSKWTLWSLETLLWIWWILVAIFSAWVNYVTDTITAEEWLAMPTVLATDNALMGPAIAWSSMRGPTVTTPTSLSMWRSHLFSHWWPSHRWYNWGCASTQNIYAKSHHQYGKRFGWQPRRCYIFLPSSLLVYVPYISPHQNLGPVYQQVWCLDSRLIFTSRHFDGGFFKAKHRRNWILDRSFLIRSHSL